MQVSAQLKNIRISARKVRMLRGVLKDLNVVSAKYQLEHTVKRSAKPLAKLLDSAVANAHNNFSLVKENLFIKDLIINEGSKLKRFKAKGFGMTSPIQKKTSHIKITLEEKVPGLKASETKTQQKIEPAKIKEVAKQESAAQEIKEETAEKKISQARSQSKPEVKKEIGKKGFFKNIGKRLFRRKAI